MPSSQDVRGVVGLSPALVESVSGSGDDCMERNEAELPLSGVTVVSLEQAIAAPLASRHLADWGARVIKIERPGNGDFCRDYDYVLNGLSSQFVWTNRSKESLALESKEADGRAALGSLL